MRNNALVGVLGALGLVGSATAQAYGNGHTTTAGGNSGSGSNGNGAGSGTGNGAGSGAGSGAGNGAGTCPVGESTIFVTVTPSVLPTIVSTVYSTIVSTVGSGSGSGQGGQGGFGSSGTNGFQPSTSPIGWSPSRTITIPCNTESSGGVPWSTDFLTITLPPAPTNTGSSSGPYTYTIVSPGGPQSGSGVPGNGGPGGQGVQPSGGNAGGVTTIYPGPFGISSSPGQYPFTETLSGGGNGGSPPFGTITITAPGGSPSGAGQGGPNGPETSETIVVVWPSESAGYPGGPGSQGGPNGGSGSGGSGGSGGTGNPATTTPCESTGNAGGAGGPGGQGVSETTIWTAPGGSGNGAGGPGGQSVPFTITLSAPGESPSNPAGGSEGPGGSGVSGGQSGPQTITITAPGESPSSPAGGSEGPGGPGGQGIPETFTVTVPTGSPGNPETSPCPEGSGSGPSGAFSGSTPEVITVTGTANNPEVPGGQGIPYTVTLTAPGIYPSNPAGGSGGSSGPGGSGGSGGSGPGGSGGPGGQGLPGNGGNNPQTVTVTGPEESPSNPSSTPCPEESSTPLVVTVTGTNLTPGAVETITFTAPGLSPGNSAGGPGGAGGQGVPHTITVTAPGELPSNGAGGPGGSGSGQSGNPSGGLGGPGGQGVPPTFTVSGPGESAGNSGGSQGQGTTPCPEGESGSVSHPNTIIVTGPNGGSGGGSGAFPTAVTVTVPENPSGGLGGNGGGNPALPTITATAPGNPWGGPGGSNGGNPSSPGFGSGNPSGGAEGSNGGGAYLPTITVTAPGSGSGSGAGTGAGSGSNGGPGGQGIPNGPGGSGEPTVTVTGPGEPGEPTVTVTVPGGSGGSGGSGVPEGPGGYGGNPSGQPSSGPGASGIGSGAGVSGNPDAGTPTDSVPAGGYGAGHPTPQIGGSGSQSGFTAGPGGQETVTVISTRAGGPTHTVTIPEESLTATAEPSANQGGSVPCDTSSGSGISGALPTNTFSPSRSPISVVPTSGWNATPTESIPAVSLPPVPSFPAPVAAPSITEIPTGPLVECVKMTSVTMASKTLSWCALLATVNSIDTSTTLPEETYVTEQNSVFNAAPTQTTGGYIFSRDNAELPGPSTLATVVVRSPASTTKSLSQSDGPSPPACGNRADLGDFTFNFDDLPPLGGGSKAMPLFSPYHRFYFSSGFDVLPPPPAPFDPSSGNLMIQFTPSSISNLTEPGVPSDTAKISVGPQISSSCFPFNFNGFSLGCDSQESPCVFNFTGLRFDEQSRQEKEVVWQTASVPGCPSMSHCKLSPVVFTGFDRLTSVQISLKVDDVPKTWWADDLSLGWSDNQCEKADCRSKVRDTTRKRDDGSKDRKSRSRLLDFAQFRG
ncbi:uncharacterized protein F4822DRAFT_337519 [Hypoxylon trugodes]|uniref:uncharacterized protein n=1 Tax=Hypoxylon trugodes TaxID=326681 RepID=UPI00219FC8F0|nr:uncharacterized protein F4822DRAFT_337519 [Hypoxylon trugodes]KAI1385214.1 hypothetical protein F4822DRAFT_337519 [Hypoxylon trugodes]